MNPYTYEELKLGHRHAPEHFRRTFAAGLVPVGLALLTWWSHFPRGGPGIYATAGLAISGLLMLWSLRAVHSDAGISGLSRRLIARSDRWYPAALILAQSFFIALTVLLLWFTICELGFAASWLQHSLLIAYLLLLPIRRILQGTEPMHPSPLHELVMEFLGYLNTCIVTLFIAGCATLALLPPDKPLTGELPPSIVLVWLPAILVIITCVILLIDHVLRKMPQPAATEAKDELD
jgi:hypothetical protein